LSFSILYTGNAADETNLCNLPTDCSAKATEELIWPPNGKMIMAGVDIADPECDSLSIQILGITQNGPLSSDGDGDAFILEDGLFQVRAERNENGRIYRVAFEATNGGDSCKGQVSICVPSDVANPTCVDDGDYIDSTLSVADETITTNAFSLRGKGGDER
jgi:hypothetical protein